MNKNQELINNLETVLAESIEAGVPKIQLNAAKRTLKNLENGKAGAEEFAMTVAAMKMNMNGATIDDTDTLLKFSKALKTKEYISFLNITISRDKYNTCNGVVGINSSPIGRAFHGFKAEESIVVPVGVGYTHIGKHSFAPFTKECISIQFKSENDLSRCADFGIKIVFAGRHTIACLYNEVFEVWENVVTGKKYTEAELLEFAEKNDGDVRLHKCFVYSPSDTRNTSYAAMDVTTEDRREEHLDKVSNGAWSKVKAEVLQMEMDGKDAKAIELFILKSMPRFGQLKAGSSNLGAIVSWAFYNGNFETSCGETIDGTAYLRASFVAQCLTEILGIRVTEKAVGGLFIQCRPDMQKGAYLVVNDFSFDELHDSLNGAKGCEIFGSQKDSAKPNMIVDKNIVKVDSDFDNKDIFLELLEIAAPSAAHYSKQMHEKPMVVNPEAAGDLAYDLGINHVSSNYDNIFNAKASIPTPGEAAKGFVSDLVANIAPEIITENPAILRSLLKNATQSNVNATDKLKFKIDGSNARLISDYSELMVGVKGRENAIVKYGEIWMPHAEKFFKKKFRKEAIEIAKEKSLAKDEAKAFISNYVNKKMVDVRIVMIKYPSMGVKEYYLARPLTLREIRTRINALNVSANKKKALFMMFAEQSEGVAMLPAIKLVMFQCAGLDYDYDGATFVYDQRYSDILRTQKPEATDIE